MHSPYKRIRPHTTIRGRIVYERKVHEFTSKDVARVFRRVIERDSDTGYIGWVVDLLILLIKIALASIAQLYKETLPAAISEFVIKLFSELIKALEAIGIAGYNFIVRAIAKAFGLNVIEAGEKGDENGSVEGQTDGDT